MFGRKKLEEGPEVPSQIGRYRLLEKIGSGGFGSVYKAFDSEAGTYVAIKTCDIPDADNRARAFREARLCSLEMVVKEDPERLSEVAPDAPAPVVAIVERAMRKNPAKRFGSAAELRAALDEAYLGVLGGPGLEAVGETEMAARVPKTVLIVEDDEAQSAGLRQVLEEEGYAVETARDGLEALERLDRGEPPAVILLDLMMPRMDGWQFMAQWRRQGQVPRIPIVLLSGVGAIPDAPGVADFLRKPVSAENLLRCVQRYCG